MKPASNQAPQERVGLLTGVTTPPAWHLAPGPAAPRAARPPPLAITRRRHV